MNGHCINCGHTIAAVLWDWALALSRLPLMFGSLRQPDEESTGFDGAAYDESEGIRLPDERERVVSFRFDQLVTAGYASGLARRLAEDLSVDWH